MEKVIAFNRKRINSLHKKIKILDEKSESFFIHPDNNSPNKKISDKIRDDHTYILTKTQEMEALILKQQNKIDLMIVAKDKAFDMIRDLKIDLQAVL